MGSDGAGSSELIGRDADVALLDQILDQLLDDSGRAVVITGAPGIGKTALIAEALRRAEERGYETLSGRAAEFERDLPFGVLADAFGRYLGASGSDGPDLPDTDMEVLASVLPSLVSHASDSSVPPEPDERHRRLRALRALLGRLAGERPLVVALDDLHWADSASIDLVCHCLHRGLDGHVLLVLASRPGQSEPRLLTALGEAERHGLATRIELAPLSPAEAQQLLGEVIDKRFLEAVYRESGGNPFYLEELAAAAARRGSVPVTEEGTFGTGVPAAVSAAIQSEIEGLSPLATSIVRAATLLAEPFEADLAAEAAEVDHGSALAAVDELLATDLIRPGGGPYGFRFRHPIVRRAIYERTGAGWRLAAHVRAAAALEARGASLAMRAYHVERCARTGDEDAIELLWRAGQEATTSAPASAARWFGAALRLIPPRSDNLDRRLDLMVRRAAALGVVGRMEESREALRSYLQLSERDPVSLRVQAAVLSAMIDELLGRQEEGRNLLIGELTGLHERDSAAAAELMREIAFTCFMDADWGQVSKWARASLDATCVGMVRVGALSALALGEFGQGDVSAARRFVSEAAELFDSLSDADLAAHQPGIAIWLGWAEVCVERFADAVEHLHRGTVVSRAIGQRHLTVGLLTARGLALATLGRIADLAEVADNAVEAALLSESSLFLSWAMTVKCALETHRGDAYAAIRFGEQAMGAGRETRSPLSDLARVQLAQALLESGEPQRCRALLLRPDGRPRQPPFPQYEPLCYELLTLADVALDQIESARRHAEQATDVAERLGLSVSLAQARRAQATVSLALGEAHDARTHALESIAAADRAGATIEAARSRILAGRTLAAAGDRKRAVADLRLAQEQLSRCGALHYCEAAARELRKLGRVARRVAGTDGGGMRELTPREVEVMELVSAGHTNREIAGKLCLSVRTVDRHTSRIFEKLGVHSRAAAVSQYERDYANQRFQAGLTSSRS